MTDVLPYRTMAYNNAWANHRLLTACLALTPEEFIAKRTGFFPSVRATSRASHSMLSATSVKPPQLDEFFAVGEAPLRAAEFAELGWTEDKVWDKFEPS